MASDDSDTDGLSVATAAVLTNPGRIADAADNAMMATALPDDLNSNQSGHEVDNSLPTVFSLAFISTGPYNTGDVITLQTTFSESVTIAAANLPSIPLTIGTTSRVATTTAATINTTHNFTYTVLSTDSDTDGISVASAAVLSNPGSISDAAGNTMTATALPDNLNSNQSGHTVDNSRPTISGINFTSTGPYKSGDVITLQATFSEAVTIASSNLPSIPLTIGSNDDRAATAAAATKSTRPQLQLHGGRHRQRQRWPIGSHGCRFNQPRSISDAAGNAMTDTALPDNLNSNQSGHKVDNSLPAVSSIAFTSTGPYKAGEVITLQATFSEAVTINDGAAASIPLTIGTNSRNATAAATATASTTF